MKTTTWTLLAVLAVGCRVADKPPEVSHPHADHGHSTGADHGHGETVDSAHNDPNPEHHVHEAHEGTTVYRCPMDCESGRSYETPVDCPICGMDTVAMALGEKAHADHSAKHGGLFFMAPDQWHHLEGVMVSDREFRLYLYNNFTKPLPVTALEATADVVRRDAEDDDIGTPESYSLTPSADAAYLRLLLPESYSLPIAIDIRVVFAPGQKRELFNFSFHHVTGRP